MNKVRTCGMQQRTSPFWWALGSLAYCIIASLLLQNNYVIGDSIVGATISSCMNFFIQVAFCCYILYKLFNVLYLLFHVWLYVCIYMIFYCWHKKLRGSSKLTFLSLINLGFTSNNSHILNTRHAIQKETCGEIWKVTKSILIK